MATKNNPGAFDCYGKADPDEPIFVLRATDPDAPGLIHTWASRYEMRKRRENKGPLFDRQMKKIAEALRCAEAMEAWQKANAKPSAPALKR